MIPCTPSIEPVDRYALKAKIRQRRAQMIVHSYIYYHLDDSVISDEKWQQWANELVELQKTMKVIGFYDTEFEDWDGSTGMHLPKNAYAMSVAKMLLTDYRMAHRHIAHAETLPIQPGGDHAADA